MTEQKYADFLWVQFSLLKNEKEEYVSLTHITKECCLIAITHLQELSRISESPYYSVEYYEKVKEIILEKYNELPEGVYT